MVTTEANDADGWNISIINNGKRFLKTSSFPQYLPSYLRTLQMDVLRVTGARRRRERSWKFPFFPFQTSNRNDSCCLSDLLQIAPHKEHFFVRVIVHKSFVL